MTKDEVLKLALEALTYADACLKKQLTTKDKHEYAQDLLLEAGTAIKEALAQPEQEPVACVYKATTKKGEIAHFGEYSAAKAWAGWGTVEQVPLKTLTLISKSIKPCPTCEALARTVMLDQTSHDTTPPQRTWVALTDDERIDLMYESGGNEIVAIQITEAKLKAKNGFHSTEKNT